jgi:hypothetical protein
MYLVVALCKKKVHPALSMYEFSVKKPAPQRKEIKRVFWQKTGAGEGCTLCDFYKKLPSFCSGIQEAST